MTLPLTPPTTPDFSAQLQRIDILHQKLKFEAARTQEYLAKLKRGEELYAQTQAQTVSRSKSAAGDPEMRQPSPNTNGDSIGKSEQHFEKPTRNGASSGNDSVCCCQHHQSNHLSEKEQKLADEYRKKMPSLGSNFPPLPTHVDEREVRDLEKRVRGLEGRVRGFEGLPPDREMALLEVERLRRELEGLARRREGLFGLMDDKSKTDVVKNKIGASKNKNDSAKAIGKVNGKASGKSNGKSVAQKG